MEFLKKLKVFLTLKQHDNDFKPEHLKFAEVKLETGETLTYDGEELLVGMPIAIVTPDGALPAPDGKHMTVDGMTIVIEGGQGVVTEIVPAIVEEEKVEQAEEGAPASTEAPTSEPEKVLKTEVERIIQERERTFSDEKEAIVVSHKKEIEALTEIITKQNEVIENFNAKPSDKPAQEKFLLHKKKNLSLIQSFAEQK